MDVNEFHNIYAHSHKGLLRTTAKRLGNELIGDMHACTGCSMSKAIRKGIAHETKRRSDKKLGRVFVDLGGSCLLYTSPSPRDKRQSRMPSSA